jgi:predicted nuclease with TOPRIM domain
VVNAESIDLNLLLTLLLGGGLVVTLLQRLFSNRDASKKASVEKQQTIDEASVEFFKGLRDELHECREENRRVNDKTDQQARELYTLKGKYEAEKEQREQVSSEYFNLLQRYTAALLEVEVLRAALKEHSIEIPNIATLVAKTKPTGTIETIESEAP